MLASQPKSQGGEMTGWVKCSLCKQQHLSLDPQGHIEAMHGEAHLTLVLGMKTRQRLASGWPANLAELASSGVVKALVSKVRVRRDGGRRVLSTTGLHSYID